MLEILASRLGSSVKRRPKAVIQATRQLFVKQFRSYGAEDLASLLRSLGIIEGDTVMLHSGFALSGFRGSPKDLADVFVDVVGPTGNLLMVSLPYSSSTLDYLQKRRTFDVRHTPSHMGLVSESFRRREGVRRSLHPTHPVLALGPSADWLTRGHHKCVDACGKDSPFDKFLQLGGKIVFFNVPFSTLTFFHYLEDLVASSLPFPLYVERSVEVQTIDATGRRGVIMARAFSPEAVSRRRPLMLMKELERDGLLRRARIGNSRLICFNATDGVSCTQRMMREGRLFYDFS